MITRKNDAFVAKIVNTRLTKGFMALFAPAESLPSPDTLQTEERPVLQQVDDTWALSIFAAFESTEN